MWKAVTAKINEKNSIALLMQLQDPFLEVSGSRKQSANSISFKGSLISRFLFTTTMPLF